MKNFSIWKALFLSFFSPDLYRDVAQNWRGVGFSYLFVLVFFTLLIVSAQFVFAYSTLTYESLHDVKAEGTNSEAEIMQAAFADFVNQIPRGKVFKGELDVDVPQPYYMYFDDGQEKIPLIMFDTTGKFMSVEEAEVPILVTKKYIQVNQKDKNKIETYNLDEMETNGPIFFGPDEAWNLVKMFFEEFKWITLAVVGMCALLAMYVYKIIVVMVYALLGLLIRYLVRSDCTYDTILRLACVAITPTMIVSSLLMIFMPTLDLHLVFVGVNLLYLGFALYCNRRSVVGIKA